MKELSIEEKAKAYDEAIKRVENIKTGKCKTPFMFTAGLLEHIFPELKESEDERIRKCLIEGFRRYDCDLFNGLEIKSIISWLEKQGEQMSADKTEPKFKVGDWIIHNKNIELANSLMLVTGKDNNEYLCKDIDGQCSYNIEFIDNDYHLWTIQDAKDGDVLTSDNKCPFIYRTNTFFGNPVAYCGVRSDGVFISNSPVDHQWCLKSKVVPATKEQRDLLFKKMHKAGYEWDADKKELKKIEQNPAWSEEDEEILNLIIARLHSHPNVDLEEYSKEYDWLNYNLKSLRPQNKWKPSDEQINALSVAVKHGQTDDPDALKKLLEQLKKL